MWNPLARKAPPEGAGGAAAGGVFSVEELTVLAVEHWRLAGALASGQVSAPARHAVRKIGDLLAKAGMEAQSLDNMPHDPGMSAVVVERVVNPDLASGVDVIIETVSPLVTYRGE